MDVVDGGTDADADAMGCVVCELAKALGCLSSYWCRGRCFDKLSMTNRGEDADGPRKGFAEGGCKNWFHKRVGSVKMAAFACLPHVHCSPANGRF
jgi:hypothetical protein